jgi:hypothetical protein
VGLSTLLPSFAKQQVMGGAWDLGMMDVSPKTLGDPEEKNLAL